MALSLFEIGELWNRRECLMSQFAKNFLFAKLCDSIGIECFIMRCHCGKRVWSGGLWHLCEEHNDELEHEWNAFDDGFKMTNKKFAFLIRSFLND